MADNVRFWVGHLDVGPDVVTQPDPQNWAGVTDSSALAGGQILVKNMGPAVVYVQSVYYRPLGQAYAPQPPPTYEFAGYPIAVGESITLPVIGRDSVSRSPALCSVTPSTVMLAMTIEVE